MEDIAVKRTVIIDHKHKKVYSQHCAYQELNEADQNFFDSLFEVLWFNEKITLTNKEIGDKYGYSDSTIQKKLRRLGNLGLIRKEYDNKQDPDTGYYLCSRNISLDPIFKAWFMKELKLLPKGVITVVSVEEPTEAEFNDVNNDLILENFQSTGKIERKKLVLKRRR